VSYSKYISHIREGKKLAVDLCNQSTATKGNLEGIFGVISYWGEKRSTANIETFVFIFCCYFQPPVKEGGWQSIRHNKQKSQNILRGDYGLRHNHR